MSIDDKSRHAKAQPAEPKSAADSEEVVAGSTSGSRDLELRSTQGHRKTLQRLRDLCQDEEFRTELAKIQRIRNPERQNKRLFDFAYENDLELYLGSPLMQFILDGEPMGSAWSEIDSGVDCCRIVDEYDEIFGFYNYENYEVPLKPFPDQKLRIENYPILIAISPLATKRDVLDFVAKRWAEIRNELDIYGECGPVIRKRAKAERDQFIWEHRAMHSRALADLVCQEFPSEMLTYSDVNNIKRRLRKRYSIT